MWEEIRNKQNEEKMLALLYYARKMYDKSTIIAAINITLILISVIFAMLDIDLKWLTGILFCVFCILECSINKCIKSAAKARATFDAILFGSGIGVTLLLLLILSPNTLLFAVIDLLPVCVTGLLVFPIPNYHNMMTVIANIWDFYTSRQKFMWKGWCFENGESKK